MMQHVGTLTNMKATELIRRRVAYGASAFAELVLWHVPTPVAGSSHSYKYRLAYVLEGTCVLRYDNEAGKGDHRQYRDVESSFDFDGVDELLSAFKSDIERINHENSDS